VRDLWQQVEAHIDSSSALRAFLTQRIDDCCQSVALEAFDPFRQVLRALTASLLRELRSISFHVEVTVLSTNKQRTLFADR
jgi:hypothetical protein